MKVLRKGIIWVGMEQSGAGEDTERDKEQFGDQIVLLQYLHPAACALERNSRSSGAASQLSSLHTCHLPGTSVLCPNPCSESTAPSSAKSAP